MERDWKVRPQVPDRVLARFPHLPWPVVQVLYNRGLDDPAQAAPFLARRAEQTDPFALRGMGETVERIRRAIREQEWIIVHGDFDADGVTSTTVLVEGLLALGARVSAYIPHRVDEGYGLNETAIQTMKQRGVGLMVTVDCGIRAHPEIALANELGLDVLVTDHHSPAATLPAARAIVNPHQPGCPYPHKVLSGVGIAWKLVQALWQAEVERPLNGTHRGPLDPETLLEFVALGTVADIVSLTGENRWLVWRGLERLRQTQRPGLLALISSARVKQEEISAESIAFFLAPRINAAGRLDSAMLAYRLLRARSLDEALPLAEALEHKNRERQRLTESALQRAEAQLTDPTAPLLLVSDPECAEGIVGLVAGRLLERFYRPTVVVSQGPELSRASCRSIDEFHITHALDAVAHLLERYGGHAAAAGFTVRTAQLPALEEALLAIAGATLGGEIAALRPRLLGEGVLPLHEVDEPLVEALAALAPFGEGNEEPLWLCRSVEVQGARAVGSNGAHLQLTLEDQRQRRWRAIAFRQGHRLAQVLDQPCLDLAYTVKKSVWQGQSRLELQIEAFRPARERVAAR